MRAAIIAVSLLLLVGVGVVFVGGASPAIIVAPEKVFHWPVIGSVTNTMFTSWFVVIFLIVLAFSVGRRLSLVPSGFSGAVEAAVEAFYNIVVQVAGEKNGRRFFPLAATIFFFILTSNYFGLLPINNVIGLTEVNPGFADKHVEMSQSEIPIVGLNVAYIPTTPDSVDLAAGEKAYIEYNGEREYKTAKDDHKDHSNAAPVKDTSSKESHSHEGETITGFNGLIAPYFRSVMTDVNAPLAIAIFSFLFVEFWGLQTLGVSYLSKFFSFGKLLKGDILGGIIDVFVGLLEFVSELSRMVSFTFRLFGNIFAGEVLLLMMTFLVPFVLVDVFYALELFVGLIQAFVFAMLTLVFAVTAVSHHGDEAH
ncbi:MAG: hypothetical protein CL752_04955 [Chloroflexi bacterium]|nr:hypothetical protein [Chloroflexota bacterium]MCH2523475.1 F0F1 ATP synthase subunit A [Dehalococcoidia bacterium]|tara:strand:+ start:7044 stop:8141 length:1098 start_codon:yes stop_codon:yes gene_type:complete